MAGRPKEIIREASKLPGTAAAQGARWHERLVPREKELIHGNAVLSLGKHERVRARGKIEFADPHPVPHGVVGVLDGQDLSPVVESDCEGIPTTVAPPDVRPDDVPAGARRLGGESRTTLELLRAGALLEHQRQTRGDGYLLAKQERRLYNRRVGRVQEYRVRGKDVLRGGMGAGNEGLEFPPAPHRDKRERKREAKQ